MVHGTDLTLDEFLALNGPTRMADLMVELKHHRHEGWNDYEDRWSPGTCPQENHELQLTWMVTTHELLGFAYSRLKALIEDGAEPEHRELYSREPGKHVSEIRQYDGEPAYRGTHALPMP